jgi:hypothetical protein
MSRCERGCQEKNSPPPLRGDMDVVAYIQSRLQPWRGFGLGRLGLARVFQRDQPS